MPFAVQRHLGAVQQFLDRDRSSRRGLIRAGGIAQQGGLGRALHGHAMVVGRVQQGFQLAALHIGTGQHDQGGQLPFLAQPFQHRAGFLHRAQDGCRPWMRRPAWRERRVRMPMMR